LLLSGTLDYKKSFGKSNTDPNTNYTTIIFNANIAYNYTVT